MKTLSEKLKDIDQLDNFVDLVAGYSLDLEDRGVSEGEALSQAQIRELGLVDACLSLEAKKLIDEAEAHYESEQEILQQRISAQLCQQYGDNECEVCA